MSGQFECDKENDRIFISMQVVDEDGDEVTGIEYRSPRGTRGFCVPAMLADVTLLAGAWTKALGEQCKPDGVEVVTKVAEAAD